VKEVEAPKYKNYTNQKKGGKVQSRKAWCPVNMVNNFKELNVGEEQEKNKEEMSGKISRRKFLKDAGLIVGGATVGSMAVLSACKGETTTVTSTKTVTTTAPGAASTVTVTSPPVTKIVEGMPVGTLTLKVNGNQHYVANVDPGWSLAFVLRDKLGYFGLKVGCDRAECGTCTIIVDGRAIYACAMLAVEAEGLDIQTIEGLAKGTTLHPVQKAFLDNGAFNCGYCTPGHIMSTVALLQKTPKPTLAQVKESMSGNLCWCGDYTRIADAILKIGG
jgi:xanthine dehydrogenase YagT iron-sulfur-binding subunit